jgi:hypothetical protein
LTERLSSNIEDYPAERKRPSKPVSVQRRKEPRSEEEFRKTVVELSAGKGEFSLKDLMDRTGLDEEKAERVAHKMLESGLVYEAGPGRFKPIAG